MGKRHISRRHFLGEASCAAVGTTAFLSSILNLGMINTASARPHIIGSNNDYKAMVCILLAGGCDTHNVLLPTQQGASGTYAEYQATRGDLALENVSGQADQYSNLTYLDSMGNPQTYSKDGSTYGLHAGMPGLHGMYESGDAAFIANIGTLIEPIANKAAYDAGGKKLPIGLYSHSDQIMQWQTSVPQSRSAVGVGGRMADLLQDMNSIPEISMNISLSGKNQFQSGQLYNEYSIGRNADENNIGFDGYPSWYSNYGHLNHVKNSNLDSLVEQEYANIFQKTIGSLTKQTTQSIEIMRAALGNVVPLNTNFGTSNLSQDLKKIAELISVQQFLGAKRQIFFVTYGGWDHHDNVLGSQAAMLPVVDEALTAFNAAMKEISRHDDVVTFTISDFARTLTSNGNGSDHAWGANQIIMGGPIAGSEIHGSYPSLSLTSDYNLSNRGRLLPTTSVDEMYAELALWFGTSPNDLDYILPNLCNFYSSSGCPAPVPNNYAPIGLIA